jgi:hypothetical protein
VGPYIPYGHFQTTGEMGAKFGSDRFRNVDLYKVQTFIFIYTILAGVPGIARDEKLRKQIFEITWRDKGWIG